MRFRLDGTVVEPTSPTYEALRLDGGWLTKEGIQVASGAPISTVERSLVRFLKQGWVERRVRGWNQKSNREIFEYRAIERDEYGEPL